MFGCCCRTHEYTAIPPSGLRVFPKSPILEGFAHQTTVTLTITEGQTSVLDAINGIAKSTGVDAKDIELWLDSSPARQMEESEKITDAHMLRAKYVPTPEYESE